MCYSMPCTYKKESDISLVGLHTSPIPNTKMKSMCSKIMGRLRHTSRVEGHYHIRYGEAIPYGNLCTNFAHIIAVGAVTKILPYLCLKTNCFQFVASYVRGFLFGAFAVVDDANIRRLF